MKRIVFMISLLFLLSGTICTKADDMLELMQPIDVSAQLKDIDIKVGLMYDDTYAEAVLLPGKRLTGELIAKNTSAEAKNIQFIIALYNENNRLANINFQEKIINAQSEENILTTVVLPEDINGYTARIMIWDNYNNTDPYTHLTINVKNKDYFGDSYTTAQPLIASLSAAGNIDGTDDTDVFEFTPAQDGLYSFELYGEAETQPILYKNGDFNTQLGQSKKDMTNDEHHIKTAAVLCKEQKYYLYVKGNTPGKYKLNAYYAVGNVCGIVYPTKSIDGHEEFNNQIQAKVILTTYAANEFTSASYLKEWSKSTSDQTTFSMMAIRPGDYLLTCCRPGYLSRYTKVSVNNDVADVGTKTLIAGDINGDNIIDLSDMYELQDAVENFYPYESKYDLNGDEEIDNEDYKLLRQNIGKTSNDYGENVNVISAKTELQKNKINITGNAKPDTEVICTVYTQDGFGIYNGSARSDQQGGFSFAVPMYKAGNYKVVLTAEERAFDYVHYVVYAA